MTTITEPPPLAELKRQRLEQEVRRLTAAADRTVAEAASYASNAELAAAQTRHALKEYAEHEASDIENLVYKFNTPVLPSSVGPCISTLGKWSRLNPNAAIEIVFSSPGGSVIDGMALFDYIIELRAKGHKVTTVCRGMAASMAGILLQAGDVRVIGRESYLMIHEISAGTGGKIGEIEDAVKFYKMICERVVDIFVARSGGKTNKTTFKKNWVRTDWWLSSGDALAHGFVDEIRG